MKSTAGNPIITQKFTCDPTAIVHGDEIFLYTGHDESVYPAENYEMNLWLCFSSRNLVDWIEHPVPLKANNFNWASGDAYASKVIEKNNLFYWFVSVSHATKPGKAIGVASSDRPCGPFSDKLGAPLITHDMLPRAKSKKANLDPTVLIDDDEQVHLFWGNGICYHARLDKNFSGLASEIHEVALPGFEEGAHIHKRNGWYYLSYGFGMPEKVAYAMSRNIDGPWEFKGIVNEIAYNCETNRPCIIEFKDQSYFIYHNGALPHGGSHRRSVCIDYLHYNTDDTIQQVVMTSEGVLPAM